MIQGRNIEKRISDSDFSIRIQGPGLLCPIVKRSLWHCHILKAVIIIKSNSQVNAQTKLNPAHPQCSGWIWPVKMP